MNKINVSSFSDLNVNQQLIDLLAQNGIQEPTPVQAHVIPFLFEKRHCIFQSETGTGKTFAYLLPLISNRIAEKTNIEPTEPVQKSAKASYILIVAPTNELASQIKSEAEKLLKQFGMKAVLCIGGAPLSRQIEQLKNKPDIIIGGAARLLELMRLKKIKSERISTLILDEVDRLLSPELRDFVTDITSLVPSGTHLIACSATIKEAHQRILNDARKHIATESEPDKAHHIETIIMPQEDVLQRNITHWVLYAEQRDKIDVLRSFLYAEKPEKALIFCAHTGQIANIAGQLQYKKIACTTLHAKSDKVDRKKAIDDFRSGRVNILITSDLASRGLDIIGITHIIQMDMPQDDDFFIHRAGRTARAGKKGINAVFGTEREIYRLAALEKKLGIIIYPKELYEGKVTDIPQDQSKR